MPFKVVKTIEDGEELISAIPDGWEKDGALCWPPGPSGFGKKLEKLRSNEFSLPDKTWMKMSCVLKKRNIVTFRDALLLEKKLNEVTTENEGDILSPKGKKSNEPDFNAMMSFDDILGAAGGCSGTGAEEDLGQVETISQVVVTQQKETIDEILSLVSNLAKSFDDFKTEVRVKQDKTLELLQSSTPPKVPPKAAIHLANVKNFPLSSIEDLEDFNAKLKDVAFQNDVVAQMNNIAGTDGKCDGDKVAFIIADKMFARQLLTQLTWTGFSRTASTKKAFNVYANIIRLFHEVVHGADNTYTEKKNPGFFQTKNPQTCKCSCESKRE